MNMNKKKVLVAALAISLIAILSFGTIAWFNATDSITNTFKVADSDDSDTQPDFSVNVFESNDTEDDGILFEDVLPGAQLAKDPTVENTGDYSMYTRVIVTLSNADEWIAASMKYDLVSDSDETAVHYTILEELVVINDTYWIRYDAPTYTAGTTTTDSTLSYVYYYNAVVAADAQTVPVFTTVTFPTQLQQEDMDYGTGADFTITVKADAIQSENIAPTTPTANRNEAYNAFITTANWAAGSEYPQP